MPQQFRPLKTGNPVVDEAFRQTFDAIYTLQGQAGGTSSAAPAAYSLGRAVLLCVNGTLRIQNDAAPRVYMYQTFSPSLLRIDVKQAPIGAAASFSLGYVNAGGTLVQVAAFSLTAGNTSCTASAAAAIPAGSYLRLDVTTVGTTFPGSDLTLTMA